MAAGRLRKSKRSIRWLFAALIAVAGFCALAGPALGTAKAKPKPLAVGMRASGRKLSVSLSHARSGAGCVLTVSAKNERAQFSVWKVGKSGSARVTWTVPPNAPSGNWRLSAICHAGKTVQKARAEVKLKFKGSGRGGLVKSSGGGRGGGNQSCQPIRSGGSGQVCFIDDPFATYADPYVGADIGQCTWYAAGMRPDLDGIERFNASTWLTYARKAGIPTGSAPAVGAIAVNTTADGGVGHVAYVAGVANGGSTLILDEANLYNSGGVYLNVSTPASSFQGYVYGGPAGNGSSSGSGTGSGSAGGPGTPSGPPATEYVWGHGSDNGIYEDIWNGSSWSGFNLVAPNLGGDPVVVGAGAGQEVWARGTNGEYYEDIFNGTAWSGFNPLSSQTFQGNPIVVGTGNGQAVWGLGTNGEYYQDIFSGSSWSGFNPLSSQTFQGDPVVVGSGTGQEVWGHGSDNGIYEDIWNGSSWSGFNLVAPNLGGDPVVVGAGAGQEVWARGTNGEYYEDIWSGSAWSGFHALSSQTFQGNPVIQGTN
jgi:surface antigen